MKIATWNVERLKHKKSIEEIISVCENTHADILVLTESDEQITTNFKYCFHTPTPPPFRVEGYSFSVAYKQTEHRVSIYTNYEPVCHHSTYDDHTALCVELKTEKGNLLIYGTIVGIVGNRNPNFESDLIKQAADFRRLTSEGHSLCICGDYNCSFADNYYFTKSGRKLFTDSFSENNIELVTAACPSCVDHIAISKQFIGNSAIQITEWNIDKSLSDHKGIAVDFK